MGVLVLLIAVVLPAFFAWTLRRSAKAAFAHARLDRGASAIIAAFGLLFAAVGGTKTNSPPAWLWLDPSSDCGGAPHWHSVPSGIEGTGNPLLFHPSELAPGTYEVYATTADDSPHVRASATVNIRRLVLADGHEVVNVDAADTTPHAITLDEGSYSPDGYTVTSEPAGIDDLTFVPADLDPGVAYHVRIFNGLCGSADVTVNNLALVSETEAEWPADRTRTDIGVGEVVRLSLRPTLQSNVTWSCFGSLIKQEANESVVKVRATDTHGSAKVSAMIGDIRLSMQFMVFSPTGYSFAEAYTYGGANAYPGFAGVEGLIDVYLAPTNVSFANVWMEEGYAEATNVSGWFLWPGNSCNHDSEHGAFIPCEISSRNFFTDMIGSDFKPGDWIDGEMKWEIPTSWWIIPEDGASTNRHQMSRPRAQMFSIRRNGTFTITKFGTGLTRTPRGMVTEIPYQGEEE